MQLNELSLLLAHVSSGFVRVVAFLPVTVSLLVVGRRVKRRTVRPVLGLKGAKCLSTGKSQSVVSPA